VKVVDVTVRHGPKVRLLELVITAARQCR
jgi:hypothetical protein